METSQMAVIWQYIGDLRVEASTQCSSALWPEDAKEGHRVNTICMCTLLWRWLSHQG